MDNLELKPGDWVRSLQDGDLYKVVKVYASIVELEDGLVASRDTLKRIAFQQGDRIKEIGEEDHLLIESVQKDEFSGLSYTLRDEVDDTITTWTLSALQAIFNPCGSSFNNEINTRPHQCKCETRTLLITGCRCGGV